MQRQTFLGAALALPSLAVGIAPAAATETDDMMKNRKAKSTVGVLLGGYSVFLDWAGPAEVFYSAGFNGRSDTDEYRVATIGKTDAPVTLQVLGSYRPQYSIATAPALDVLIIPGSDMDDLPKDPATVRWVKEKLASGTTVLTVCTGALIAAHMGLLEGLRVTTTRGALKALAKAVPSAQVVSDQLFADNGSIVTAAGTATGIDAALHIIERRFGKQRALDEREYLEYKWPA